MPNPTKFSIYLLGGLANIFECYEFSVYAYLAGMIAINCFPNGNMASNLIKVFLLFAVSYLVKPIGAFFWGMMGERINKTTVIRWSLISMAIPTFCLALIPSYHQVGLFSPILLILLRILQGFAMSGELPSSACYLYELSNQTNKRLHCSLVSASSMLGMLLGASIVTVLSALLSTEQMTQWGWRVPFLLGLPLAVIIYSIRNRLFFSKQANITIKKNNNSIIHILKLLITTHSSALIAVMLINGFIVVSYYLLFLWLPNYFIYNLGIDKTIAHSSTTLSLSCLIIFTLLFTKLFNKINQQTLLMTSIGLLCIVIFPLFYLLNHIAIKNYIVLFIINILLALILALAKSVNMVTLIELFPENIRCIGLSAGFNLSLTLFASMSPALASFLIHQFSTPYAALGIIYLISIGGFIALVIKK